MSFKKKNPEKNYKKACKEGYCPSLDERENNRIKELANRLNATSYKETLTNVLEWQNRNISYWFERAYLRIFIVLSFACLMSAICFLVFQYPNAQIWFWCFFSAFVTSSLVAVCMIHFYRKLPLKQQLFNILSDNISTDWILDDRLCVCRDYAKLTACLLLNIYPEKEIYFVRAPSHVATGIIIGEKLYILDKYLPVVTIDKWHEKWHKGGFFSSLFSRLPLFSNLALFSKKVERLKGTSLESVDKCYEKGHKNCLLSKTSRVELNKDKLAKEMKRLLGIQSSVEDNKNATLKLPPWKKGAILYEDDEIVNYSLARRLRMLITTEMLEPSQIADLEIIQDIDDLRFEIKYKFER